MTSPSIKYRVGPYVVLEDQYPESRALHLDRQQTALVFAAGPGRTEELEHFCATHLALSRALSGPVLQILGAGHLANEQADDPWSARCFMLQDYDAGPEFGVFLRALEDQRPLVSLPLAGFIASQIAAVRPWGNRLGPRPQDARLTWDGRVLRHPRLRPHAPDKLAIQLGSPELIKGLEHTEGSGIYVLGVLLHWLLTTEHPLVSREDEGMMQMLSKIIGSAPTPLRKRRPDIPRQAASTIDACLHPQSSERPSLEALLAACQPAPQARARAELAALLGALLSRERAEEHAFWETAKTLELEASTELPSTGIAAAPDLQAALHKLNEQSARTD